MSEEFGKTIAAAYAADGPTIDLGRGVHEGELAPGGGRPDPAADDEPPRPGRRAPPGPGKTVTLQTLAEQLSAAGVAVFAADVKGDVSGIAVAGRGRRPRREADDRARASVPAVRLPGRVPVARRPRPRRARARDRHATSARSCWRRSSRPTRRRRRASALVFHYADEKGLPLLDLSDLRALLTFLESDAGKARARGHRRPRLVHRRRAAARPGRARGRRRHRVLRGAAARHRGPDPHRRPTAAASSRCSSCPRCRTSRACSRRP